MTERQPPSIKYRYGEPPIHSAGDILYYDKVITRQQRVFAAPAGSNPYGQEALVTGSDGMQIDIEREARLLPQDGHNRLYTLYAPEVGVALTISHEHGIGLLYPCTPDEDGQPVVQRTASNAIKTHVVDMTQLPDARFITLGEPYISLTDPQHHRAALSIVPEQVGVFGIGTAGGVGSKMRMIQNDASPGAKNVMNVLYPQLVKGHEALQQRHSSERQRNDESRPRSISQIGRIATAQRYRSGWF